MDRFALGLLCCSLLAVGYKGVTNPRSIPLFRYMNVRSTAFQWAISGSGGSTNGRRNVENFYQIEVERVASAYDLPTEYLLALIILECGGHESPRHRFEPKRFRQLKNLRDGKRRKFEYLRRGDLEGLSDGEIRALATSWGPFQIMGYHTLGLSTSGEEVTVEDLSGPKAVEIGIRWVDENYGSLLRQKRYKDAFHMHNTGRLYPKLGGPKTHDPKYVPNGLSHLAYFANGDSDEEGQPSPLAAPVPSKENKTGQPTDTGATVELIRVESLEQASEREPGEAVNGWEIPSQ